MSISHQMKGSYWKKVDDALWRAGVGPFVLEVFRPTIAGDLASYWLLNAYLAPDDSGEGQVFPPSGPIPTDFPTAEDAMAQGSALLRQLAACALNAAAHLIPLPPKLGLATIDGEVKLVPQQGEVLTVPTSAGHHIHNGTDETKA